LVGFDVGVGCIDGSVEVVEATSGNDTFHRIHQQYLQWIYPTLSLDMKVRVQLYVAGKVFYEEVIAANYQDARATALARNPTAKIVSVTAVFN